MGIAFKRPDAEGRCCDDAALKASPCDPCATAPCNIYVADNTSFGQVELNQNSTADTPAWCGEWTGLGVGSFQIQYVGGTFSAGSGPDFFICKAVSHSFPMLLLNTVLAAETQDMPLSKDSVLDGLTQAQVETEYLTHNTSMPTFPVGDFGFPETVRITDVFHPDNAGGPTFEIFRHRKLRVAQPTKLQIGLDPFDDGGWIARYSLIDSGAMALDASAATVQTVLNGHSAILLDGGVTVTGDATSGYAILWNVNGARGLLNPRIASRSPGFICTITRTRAGDGATKEIQTITVAACVACQDGSSLIEWDGKLEKVYFSRALWRQQPWGLPGSPFSVTTDAPVARINGHKLWDAYCWLEGLALGNVNAGKHSWKVTFVSAAGESVPGPVSNHPVYDRAYEVALSSIPVGPAGTTARKIYRTAAGDSGPYKLVATISNNVQTDYMDNLADSGLGASPPSSGGPAPPSSGCIAKTCAWRLLIMCLATVMGSDVRNAIWKGVKVAGDTPEGDYLASDFSQGFASEVCSLDQTHGVGRLSVTGSDFTS